MSISTWGALGVYFLAHLVRLLRLGVVLGSQGIRELAAIHFFSSSCSSLFPFKLGEFVRVNEIARTHGGLLRGLLAVWIERAFDVVAISAIALCALASGQPQTREVVPLIVILMLFLFLTAVALFVMPFYLSAVNLHILRSYPGRKGLAMLKVMEPLHHVRQKVRPLVHGKGTALVVLTTCIWLLEIAAVFWAAESPDLMAAMTHLTTVFSDNLAGQSTPSLREFEGAKTLLLSTIGGLAAGVVVLSIMKKRRS